MGWSLPHYAQERMERPSRKEEENKEEENVQKYRERLASPHSGRLFEYAEEASESFHRVDYRSVNARSIIRELRACKCSQACVASEGMVHFIPPGPTREGNSNFAEEAN